MHACHQGLHAIYTLSIPLPVPFFTPVSHPCVHVKYDANIHACSSMHTRHACCAFHPCMHVPSPSLPHTPSLACYVPRIDSAVQCSAACFLALLMSALGAVCCGVKTSVHAAPPLGHCDCSMYLAAKVTGSDTMQERKSALATGCAGHCLHRDLFAQIFVDNAVRSGPHGMLMRFAGYFTVTCLKSRPTTILWNCQQAQSSSHRSAQNAGWCSEAQKAQRNI